MPNVNQKQVLYCCKSMKFNGRQYEAGDLFSWGTNGCSTRRLQILIDTRHLVSTPPTGTPEEVVKDIVEEIVEEDSPDTIGNEEVPKRKKKKKKKFTGN